MDRAITATASRTTLDAYFDDLETSRPMSADEERDQARSIGWLRVERWRALLSHAPFADAFSTALLELLDAKKADLARPLNNWKRAARSLRDRRTRAHEEAFAQASEGLANLLSAADRDSTAADRLVADLDALAAGNDPSVLDLRRPPKGSKPFERLLKRVRGRSAAFFTARNAFVHANLRLVVTLAKRYTARSRLPLSDLVQEGNLGLMKAVDRFDPERGFRFSTYAAWWIRHSMARALANKSRSVRLPVYMLEFRQRLARARAEFLQEFGTMPTDEELAERTGEPVEKVRELSVYLTEDGHSLDAPLGEGENLTRMDATADPNAVEPGESMDDAHLHSRVEELLEDLRPMEADIIRKRFGLDDGKPRTLRQIGEEYALSRERIRQLQERALGRIRSELRAEALV